ncbi:ubiquitin-like protein ISG15 isoform X2, partial [Biomphalaria glabrata]
QSLFDVFVKTLEGKTVTVQVGEHEEVTSFRKKVQEKTNVEASQQYLLLKGRISRREETARRGTTQQIQY